MNVTSVILNVNTDNAQRLFDFYHGTLGLPQQEGMGPHAVAAAGTVILFDSHSAVAGRAENPARVLVDLFVDDVAAEDARLAAGGLAPLRRQGVEYWGGIISTYEDPDGNYVQLIQYDPAQATPAADAAPAAAGVS